MLAAPRRFPCLFVHLRFPCFLVNAACHPSPPTIVAPQEAADQAQGAEGRAPSVEQRRRACRVLYRLAHYADGLYRNIEVGRWREKVRVCVSRGLRAML